MKCLVFFLALPSFFFNKCFAQNRHIQHGYYINSSLDTNSPFDIIMFSNDSSFVAIRGTGIVATKDSIYIYPENGYTFLVGRTHYSASFACIKYAVVKRSINLVGEKLPSSHKSIEVTYKSNSAIMIGSIKFTKLPQKKVSYLLKKYLYRNAEIYKKIGKTLSSCD